MRILLIGREGQIAWELRRSLACLGDVVSVGRHTSPLAVDLEQPDTIRHVMRMVEPDLIVNAAAYTAVDRAEVEYERVFKINAEAPGILAEAALEYDAGLIHYSTDYVFPGTSDSPYTETCETSPNGVYGASKLEGELAIKQFDIPYMILRTAWVYGARGNNFLLSMLRLMAERDQLSVVDDQVGAPTWSRQVAECSAMMIAECIEKERFNPEQRNGVFHLTCDGFTSWYGFAERIRMLAHSLGLLTEESAEIRPVSTAAYPTAAKRPAYSVLSNHKLQRQFGLRMPVWDDALEICMEELSLFRSFGEQ